MLVAAHDLAQIFRVESLCERRRIREIAEHHRKLAALSLAR